MNRPAAPPQAAFQQTQPATPQAFVTQQYPTAAPTGGQDYGRPAVRYSVRVALTGLPIGYSVIISLTGLPIGYSVIVALTGLPIGYNVNSSSNRSPYRIQCKQ